MATKTLEQRVAALEAEVDTIRKSAADPGVSNSPWWQQIRGTFKNDPAYDEAMQYGKEFREDSESDLHSGSGSI